jgi:lysophospholipid acyltransferase (LPLAT)-like uncharacterized protein
MKSLLAYWLILFLGRTQRWRIRDPHGIAALPATERVIFAFWHNRLALMPYVYTRRTKRGKAAAMISASRDGSFLAEILRRFGIEAVRGSTSKGGMTALRGLAERLQQGYDAVITPDGPRGPRYVAQAGAVTLARLTGAPIVPVSYEMGWKIQLKNWDAFLIPLPLSWCELRVGKPIYVPADGGDAVLEWATTELEKQLLELGGTREERERLEKFIGGRQNTRKI